MEPEQKRIYLIDIERMNKLQSLQAHPEWSWFVDEFIRTPLARFENEVHNPRHRKSTDDYVNIVRALEKVEMYQSFEKTFDSWVQKGLNAERLIREDDERRIAT